MDFRVVNKDEKNFALSKLRLELLKEFPKIVCVEILNAPHLTQKTIQNVIQKDWNSKSKAEKRGN